VQEPITPRTASEPLALGIILGGKFELCGVLGEGGTGVVYDAWLLEDGARKDRVALKVIHGHLLGDEQIRGRFAREAKILRRLTGANLCAIVDAGEVEDPRREGASLLYIALPKIEGTPLDHLLRKEAPLEIDRAVEIAQGICTALRAAHAQGVIHRDLKPANVILDAKMQPIVVDFGMAKIVTGAGTDTTALTSHNMVFGTPEYMSPEQARGDELDARCDVYAVGIMLYEMLTGAVPFSGKGALQILTAHLTTEAPPLREKVPSVSPALEAVVRHALAKEPGARYATAAALSAALVRAKNVPDAVDDVAPDAFVADTDLTHSATLPAPSPTDPPPRSRPTQPSQRQTPTVRPVAPPRGYGGGTIALWVLAVIVGVAIGVWLSLKS
jgi:serine/threonine-protein kinase